MTAPITSHVPTTAGNVRTMESLLHNDGRQKQHLALVQPGVGQSGGPARIKSVRTNKDGQVRFLLEDDDRPLQVTLGASEPVVVAIVVTPTRAGAP